MKAVHEEISLQLATLEPEEEHIMFLFATDHGAEEILRTGTKKSIEYL